MVSEDDPRPTYVQLAAILRDQIASGEITGRLPSERDIQQRYGIAPMTTRKAVRLLREAGEVVTVPGRGTFIAPKG